MEFKNNYGTVYYHDTPWNTKALNGKSLEIDSIESDTLNKVKLLLDFIYEKSKESYVLIASRVPASFNELKKIYFEAGFITVEHTLDVSSVGMDKDKINSISKKFPVIVEDFKDDNILELEDIAMNEFNFGRFFEDPFLDISKAQTRNKLWIKDLINQNAVIKVLKKKENIVGFMAYSTKGNRVDLILGGVKKNYRHLAYGFWANIFLTLIDKEMHTVISSSNIDIMNLYTYFGFKFENPRFGFHKHL